MAYLHSHDIIHRNLCTESIFLNEYLFPKIGNYGLLVNVQSLNEDSIQTSIGIKGNITYSSPELLQKNLYTKSSDVYAFALVCYEIMTLQKPFNDTKDLNKLLDEIAINKRRPEFEKEIPACYRKLIESCWSQNPEDRPTFEQIASMLKNDPDFITEDVDRENFTKYVDFIQNSKIEFHSENRVVRFDDIIEEKTQSQE